MQKVLIVTLLVGLLLPLTAVADECTDGDCINGKGSMTFATGHKYTGEFKDGARHGAGVLHLPGGRKIVGVWQNNQMKSGTYTEPDGTVYEGHWQFRERNGQGTLTFPDGRKYIGEFKSGKRHGQGTMTFPDGRKYVGDFFNGIRSGQGSMTYPDGRRYSGEFKDGQKNGQGTMIYPDGEKQEGTFKDGAFVGN
ncbi:MAG: hypothetical protein GY850_34490 [bacterium]|nr:hypothetical protein [bacterium]